MDAQGLTSDEPVIARWRAVAVHHKALTVAMWASASALAFARPLPGWTRALWVAFVTVAFAFLSLLRWRTETRSEVVVTPARVVVRYRSGFVEAHDLGELRAVERLTHPHPRHVFRFADGSRVALPDESDARAVVEAMRARVSSDQG